MKLPDPHCSTGLKKPPAPPPEPKPVKPPLKWVIFDCFVFPTWLLVFCGTMWIAGAYHNWWPFLIVGIPFWIPLAVSAYCSFVDITKEFKNW